MTTTSPASASRPPSSLDATLDTLMRRVEHATTLRERQAAVDTLFAHRRGDTPLHLVALSASASTTTTTRNLP